MRISIATKETKKLISCTNKFYHSPYWLDKNNLLFLSTNKLGNSQFIIFDLISKIQTELIHDLENPLSFIYNVQSQKLAVISQANDDKLDLSFTKLNKEHSKLIIKSRYPLDLNTQNTLQPKWFNDNKLIITANKKIYWFDQTGLIKTTPILSTDTVFSAQPINSNGNLLAVMGNQDMDVRLRTWDQLNSNDFTDSVIERSTKKEFSAKFQPNTNNIGFVSNRTGHSQIWLSNQKDLNQLTHLTKQQIKAFSWSPNGNQLTFLTDKTLWLKTHNKPEKPISLNFKVKDIYQWWQEENTDYLLLSALIIDENSNKEIPKIILLNLTTLDFTTEFKGENYWAQKVSSNTLIMNDSKGHIFKLVNNQKQTITDLDHITVQWRYYWRNNMLYIQDKKQNIWQYESLTNKAKVIQKFDLKSLFMTDFNPDKMQMLSDNYALQQKDLVLFKASN